VWVNPSVPNITDYSTFLVGIFPTQPEGLMAQMLPVSFSGTCTLESGSDVLPIVSVVSGTLVPGGTGTNYQSGSVISDAQGAIPANTTVVAQLSGATGGVGTYQMSANATATVGTAETITAANWQIVWTLNLALDMVHWAINAASPNIYTLACYNYATDRLLNFAQDVANQTFFRDQRHNLHLTDIGPVGAVASAGDGGTSAGILNPEQMRMLTLDDIQMLKTPWGRQYMAIAQSYAPNIWGIS
jgi:hypothetical protein